MRFQIMHESPGRMRLRADVCSMSPKQADLLEAWLRAEPDVDEVTVHERTCGVIVLYHGDRTALCRALSGFTFVKAEKTRAPQIRSSRAMNRAYKEKLVFLVIRHCLRRLFFPDALRRAATICRTIPRLMKAAKVLASGRLTVDVLDGIAIGASLLTGDHRTAGSVHFLLNVGETLDEWTHRKSIDDLARSMSLQVDRVWRLYEDGVQRVVPLYSVIPGDRIIVHTGHVLPLDGVLEEGDVMLNQASLTGESVPVAKRPGAAVYAGSVVEEGSSLADKLVPWCLGGSLLTWLLTGNVSRAVSVLMVDFSCALKLSMPLSVLSAMREASRHKITVKGGRFMEKISEADTVIFDKTGTLTNACPTVTEVVPFNGKNRMEMLKVAACLEEHFPHSVANAVVKAAADRGIDHREMHSGVEYIVAHGIATKIGGDRAVIGSAHFVFEDEGVEILPGDRRLFDSLSKSVSWLYLGIGGVLSAAIGISDPLRPEARLAVEGLHAEGIDKTVMLTGDNRRAAGPVAAALGIDEYRAEILPEDKADFIKAEHEAGRTVIMIGDGINDTPALSLADVGIAVGSGAVIAREVADVTIAAEDLRELVWLKRLSNALMRRINRNYRFVMGFNGSLILLGAFGFLAPAASALLHNTSTILLSMDCLTDLLDAREAGRQ